MRIEIEKNIYEGWGLGTDSKGKKIIVKKSVPGDILDVRITKDRANYSIGVIEKIAKPSCDRKEPRCQHFDQCGSCEYQQLDYTDQLQIKQNIFAETFGRGAVRTNILPIISGSAPIYYRGNMRYGFLVDTENRIHISMHDYIENKSFPIKSCYLQSELSNQISQGLANFINENIDDKQSFWQLKIRDSKQTGEVMVEIITACETLPSKSKLVNYLKTFPEIKSIYHTCAPAKSLKNVKRYLLAGSPIIFEKVGKYIFQISPDSFFQTNSLGVKNLYDKVKEFADVSIGDKVVDLFCGTGTIGIYLSTFAKEIIGVESIRSAVNDASANAKINKVLNTLFVCADVDNWLKSNKKELGNAIIILDPPRAGLSKNTIQIISSIKFKILVYVSCNPATFTRDVKLFKERGLQLDKVQPIDMFPQTHHIECVGVIRSANTI